MSAESILITQAHPLHPMYEQHFPLKNKTAGIDLSYRCVESAFLAICFKSTDMQRTFQTLSGMEARETYEKIVTGDAAWSAGPMGLRDDLTVTSPSGLNAQAVLLLRLTRLKAARDSTFRSLLMAGNTCIYRMEPTQKKLRPWPSDMWWPYCLVDVRLKANTGELTFPPLDGVAAAP
jgi:hypothetical protein